MIELYEPLKYYNQTGKQEFHQNTVNEFENLLQKSGVDVNKNRSTVKAYDKEMATVKKIDKTITKYKVFKILSIVSIVIACICALYGLFSPDYLALGISLAVIIGLIVLIVKLFNKRIKDAEKLKAKHQDKANELLREAQVQMAPLNALFKDDTPLRLIEKTIPSFEFDDKFTLETEKFFINHHDFIDFQDDKSSMLDTLSGKFMGNPFLFCRRLVEKMGLHVYHGTLVIRWTERYRDSNGRLRTRVRTQTLHASLTKPKPYYDTHTYLVYGSQAAPDLNFSRTYSHTDDLSERQLEKKIKKGAKKLKKKAEKALSSGKSFQGMTNTEFDVLFGALDRDHEVQFRLMYTPLAQNNTVDLITDNVNYGDDFRFDKKKRFNVITSEHAQTWDMNISASQYFSYSVDIAKKRFIEHNENFFKSVFFDFAPLMSVPAYLEEPCASLDQIEDYSKNFTYYEHEVMANAIGYERFLSQNSATRAILKTKVLSKESEKDTVSVTANSYYTVDRVDFVPVLGGDGRMHPIPVHWLEYIPCSSTSTMQVQSSIKNEKVSFGDTYYHGMVARKLN